MPHAGRQERQQRVEQVPSRRRTLLRQCRRSEGARSDNKARAAPKVTPCDARSAVARGGTHARYVRVNFVERERSLSTKCPTLR